jgi:hypothetical protein
MEHERGFLINGVWSAENPMNQLIEFSLVCKSEPQRMDAADTRRLAESFENSGPVWARGPKLSALRDGVGWALGLEIDDANQSDFGALYASRWASKIPKKDGRDFLSIEQPATAITEAPDGQKITLPGSLTHYWFPTFRPHRDGVCFSCGDGCECVLRLPMSAGDLATFHALLIRRNAAFEAI